jgi:hypothetical protein
MSKLERVRDLMATAERLGMDMAPTMKHADLMDIAANWNGIGPGWAPDWFRAALDTYLHAFQPAALIHDWDYAYIDAGRPGWEAMREAADDRFYKNCRIGAAAVVPWWSPQRWRLERNAFWAWRAVRRLGGYSM